eukprot:1137345-Pelagomonas_calceolata.AAC.7
MPRAESLNLGDRVQQLKAQHTQWLACSKSVGSFLCSCAHTKADTLQEQEVVCAAWCAPPTFDDSKWKAHLAVCKPRVPRRILGFSIRSNRVCAQGLAVNLPGCMRPQAWQAWVSFQINQSGTHQALHAHAGGSVLRGGRRGSQDSHVKGGGAVRIRSIQQGVHGGGPIRGHRGGQRDSGEGERKGGAGENII